MPNLDLSHDTVNSIISSIRNFQSQEHVSLQDESFDDTAEIDFGESMLRFDEDLSYQEAKTLIDDLEPDQQVTLVALMYLGRGDFTIEQWDEALTEANDGWTTHTGEYLLARPRAGDYLAEGLELFNHA